MKPNLEATFSSLNQHISTKILDAEIDIVETYTDSMILSNEASDLSPIESLQDGLKCVSVRA